MVQSSFSESLFFSPPLTNDHAILDLKFLMLDVIFPSALHWFFFRNLVKSWCRVLISFGRYTHCRCECITEYPARQSGQERAPFTARIPTPHVQLYTCVYALHTILLLHNAHFMNVNAILLFSKIIGMHFNKKPLIPRLSFILHCQLHILQ